MQGIRRKKRKNENSCSSFEFPGQIDIHRLKFPFHPGKYVFEGPDFFTVIGGLVNLEIRPRCLGPIGYANTGKLVIVTVHNRPKPSSDEMCPELSGNPKFVVVHGEPKVNSYWAGVAGTLDPGSEMKQTFRQAIRLA